MRGRRGSLAVRRVVISEKTMAGVICWMQVLAVQLA
jgi:hypothetical protein